MDLSAIIVTALLGGGFIGFVVWMAIHSRRTAAENLPAGDSENGLRGE